MRHALGVFGVLAAGVLLLVSAAMNWRFGYYLGTTEFDGFIYGSASAAADCMKALVPFFAFAALRNKMWAQAFASFVIWGVVTVYSLTSALGYSALNRQDTVGARASQAQVYQDLRSDLDRATDQLSWIPKHRPASVVKAKLDGMEVNRIWARTSECTDVTSRSGRSFCNTFAKLKAEYASANEAERLETKVSDIRAKLGKQPNAGAFAKGDPQAVILAQLAGIFVPGVTVEHIQTALIVFVSLLLEVGSSLGMYVAFSQWRLGGQTVGYTEDVNLTRSYNNSSIMRVREPVTAITVEESHQIANDNARSIRKLAPESDVERYKNERIVNQNGTSLTATTIYEDYCDWCDEHDKEPLALPSFGRELSDTGLHKAKVAGRIRYVGVSLRFASKEEEEEKVSVSKVLAA